jgi:hypothetical protein
MMIYLINSLPNACLPTEGNTITISGISEVEAASLLLKADHYRDYDDNIAPYVLSKNVMSVIGHQSVADAIATRLDNGATAYGSPIAIHIPVNRATISPQPGDKLVCYLAVPPRRLNGEDDRWTVAEISSMEIKWILVQY